jgi:hypothetical protein
VQTLQFEVYKEKRFFKQEALMNILIKLHEIENLIEYEKFIEKINQLHHYPRFLSRKISTTTLPFSEKILKSQKFRFAWEENYSFNLELIYDFKIVK